MSKKRPLTLRTTTSDICAIVVKQKHDANGNSVYIATCGSSKHRHAYDPALTREKNIEAAAELCLTPSEREEARQLLRGAWLDMSTTVFVRLDQ